MRTSRFSCHQEKVSDHYFIGCHTLFLGHSAFLLMNQKLVVLDIPKFDGLVVRYDWGSFIADAMTTNVYDKFVKVFKRLKTGAQKTIIVKLRQTKKYQRLKRSHLREGCPLVTLKMISQ